jgi:hypothetical protein
LPDHYCTPTAEPHGEPRHQNPEETVPTVPTDPQGHAEPHRPPGAKPSPPARGRAGDTPRARARTRNTHPAAGLTHPVPAA